MTSDQFKLCFRIHNNRLETISMKEINYRKQLLKLVPKPVYSKAQFWLVSLHLRVILLPTLENIRFEKRCDRTNSTKFERSNWTRPGVYDIGLCFSIILNGISHCYVRYAKILCYKCICTLILHSKWEITWISTFHIHCTCQIKIDFPRLIIYRMWKTDCQNSFH